MNTIHPNMINETMSCHKNVLTPEVGMLGTMFVGTDRYMCVITKVFSPKRVLIDWLHVDEVIKHKFVKDGVEYIPAEIATSLIEQYAPNFDMYLLRYSNDCSSSELEEWFDNDLTRYYEENTYSLRKNGRWARKGDNLYAACAIHFGHADEYRDPSF